MGTSLSIELYALCEHTNAIYCDINPNKPSGLSHPYQLDESTVIYRGIRSDISFLFHFAMKFMSATRIAQDWSPRFAVSLLGVFCLSMSNEKTPGLYGLRGRLSQKL